MKLTLQMQLLPNGEARAALLTTMEVFNRAATAAAEVGFAEQIVSPMALHRRCYYDLRERFGLSAQMAVRAVGKASEALRRDATRCPTFRPHGAMIYDQRILSFKSPTRVSLLTLAGRLVLPIIYGQYQRERFDRHQGQVDLVYRDRRFYLLATIDLPEDAPIEIRDFLGVDLGIVHLATDSDGEIYSGATVERVRQRYAYTRARLQRRQSRGATRILRRIGNREQRFRRHENHCISKRLVACAQDTKRGIALEDLTHIRSRTTVRRNQRARHSGWAFAQLRAFVAYKSRLVGVPVVALNPRYSSQTCSGCGHQEKANRPTRDVFRCCHCALTLPADVNAARVLRAWAACKPASELSAASAA